MYNHKISMKYIMLLNVKTPPNVGIQTFDQAFAACIPVYEGFGLFTRRSYFAACEQYRCRSVCAFAQSHQRPYCSLSQKHSGLFETKPAFGAYNKVRPNQVVMMDVKMPTIFGILTFMSMTSLMNVLNLILSLMR